MKEPKHKIELDEDQANGLISRIEKSQLDNEYKNILTEIIQTMLWLQFLLKETRIKFNKIRKLFRGIKSEARKKNPSNNKSGTSSTNNTDDKGNQDTTTSVTGNPLNEDGGDNSDEQNSDSGSPPPKKGHGKLGADDYTGAEVITCKHDDLHVGDLCPLCGFGHLYLMNVIGKELRVFAHSLVDAIVYQLEKLRCSACQEIFTAPMPENAQTQTYDESVSVVLAFYHYYMGLPFKRIEMSQEMFGISLSDSMQWQLCEKVGDCGYRIYDLLKQYGANSDVVYHDDSGIKILSMIKENKSDNPPKRKGMQTTALVFEGEHPICLYITGRQHAGENLDDILDLRDTKLPPIIQMSDGLSANNLKRNTSIPGNCITHGRRKFVDIESAYPQECAYVIDMIGKIYHHESIIKLAGMSAQQRLAYHQEHSKPIMDALQIYMQQKLDDNIVEPNSSLGGAFNYMLKRWTKMTKFLTVAGAPLDNNTALSSFLENPQDWVKAA